MFNFHSVTFELLKNISKNFAKRNIQVTSPEVKVTDVKCLKSLKFLKGFKYNLLQIITIITQCADPNNQVATTKVKVTFKGQI